MDRDKVLDWCNIIMKDISSDLKKLAEEFAESEDFHKDEENMSDKNMAILIVGNFLKNTVQDMGIPEYNPKSDSVTWR